jgi:glyoxylase-like metal-dependent hydrolase (beta-lactamase superfamily II)
MMETRLKRVAQCFWQSAAAMAVAFAAPAGLAAGPLRAQPVAQDVWFVQGEAALGSAANRNFISNAGFVVTPAGVVVIDALGSPALAQELLDEIRRITPQPVRYVVVTHYHADHIYGLQVFKDAGAVVVGHAAGRSYLGSDTARLRLAASREELFPFIDETTRLVPADRWLDGDTVLELGGERFHIRHAGPAHTPEDVVVAVEGRGVLFAGDLVFRGRIPFVGQADSSGWIQGLDGLLKLLPQVVVPGHGPLSRDPVADLQATRDYLAYLRETMGRAAAEMQPFDEAYAATDWSRFEGLPLFRFANRMNAYNTYLLLEQQGGK